MLSLNPNLMSLMSNSHLIRSLECEPAIMRTAAEIELQVRCERLIRELEEQPDLEKIKTVAVSAYEHLEKMQFLENIISRMFTLGETLDEMLGETLDDTIKTEADLIMSELEDVELLMSETAAALQEIIDFLGDCECFARHH